MAYFNDIVVGAVCCRVDLQGSGRKVDTDTLGPSACLTPDP